MHVKHLDTDQISLTERGCATHYSPQRSADTLAAAAVMLDQQARVGQHPLRGQRISHARRTV